MDQWMTIEEVAGFLGISTSTVRRRTNSDREFPKPVAPTRRTVRFCRREVEDYKEMLEFEGDWHE